ncbi:glutamate receptor ionotropic, delta-1-like [Portunus trituberculatus]|uniref:glutamate receptor ionotropic, delta-1-like n=1 Tax=Portunus trituberculatus TaxID=210409 RepID=UPI001E1D03AE|nr:glutamate receptor ionotropic, delta-1-like [Portunus trituberculatus]
MTGTVMTVSSQRMSVMDFSSPLFMDFQTLIYSKPSFESDLLGFVKPYTLQVWLCLAGALVVVSTGTFLTHKIRFRLLHFTSTDRSDGLDGTTTKRKKLQCDDVFQWFFATFVGQALEFGMQCVLLRLVSGIWMVMVLIVGIVYRSNLKAMMIAPKLRLPFDSMEELVETDIPCLVFEGSMIHQLFLNAEAGSLLHLLRKQALVHNDILRAMVATKAGRHATISSRLGADTAVSYFFSLSKTCPLYMTSKPFFSATSLSVGYRKGFRLRRRMDQIFRHLRDSGILGHLYERELPNATKCSRGLSIESDTRRALDLGDFFGVMCVYGGGILMASLVLLMEIVTRCRILKSSSSQIC